MENTIPRVMSFGEIYDGWSVFENENGYYVWIEVKDEYYLYFLRVYDVSGGFGQPTAIAFDVPGEDVDELETEYYGKTWRVWTDRPGYELRKATPWEE